MGKNRVSILLILIAGILWGCIGLFVRTLNSWGISSMEIVELRAFVTLIAMLIVLLIYDRKMLRIKLKDIWCFFGTGLLSIVFFNYCYFKTIGLASMSVAAVLLYTAPAIVMVLSFFLFKEKFNARKVISLVMTFIGCVLVTGFVGSDTHLSFGSILVGLGAGLGYALYSIFSRYALERGYSTFTITFYTFLVASIGTLFISDTKLVISTVAQSPARIIVAVAFGIVSTVLPYICYTLGLKNVENGKASIIASIEPVTATVLGIIIFSEPVTLTGILGVILVIVALAICNVTPRKSE